MPKVRRRRINPVKKNISLPHPVILSQEPSRHALPRTAPYVTIVCKGIKRNTYSTELRHKGSPIRFLRSAEHRIREERRYDDPATRTEIIPHRRLAPYYIAHLTLTLLIAAYVPPPEPPPFVPSLPAPLNTNVATDDRDDFDPQVTTDGAGNWIAVWSSIEQHETEGRDADIYIAHSTDDGVGTDSDIFVATSTDNGINWTDPALLNNNATTETVQSQIAHDGRPAVATDGIGNRIAVWSSNTRLSGVGNDDDIFVARSTDNGSTWSDPAPLNNYETAGYEDDENPTVTTDHTGRWVAAWTSYFYRVGVGYNSDILVAQSTDNGLTWTDPTLVNNNATNDFVSLGLGSQLLPTDHDLRLETNGKGI